MLELIEQIYISENREKFLSIEMKRAKTNLGKLIKEKEIVDRYQKARIERAHFVTENSKNELTPKFLNTIKKLINGLPKWVRAREARTPPLFNPTSPLG